MAKLALSLVGLRWLSIGKRLWLCWRQTYLRQRKKGGDGWYTVKRIDEMKAIFHGSFQRAGAERVPVDSERIVCISAGTKRRLLLGPNGVRILALGGIPGKAYERPEPFKLGALDPTVSS